ncbi:hypothetical protein LR48_Vigan10g090500 [Vigna angularis]|uniref:Uncharacterized protein n=1 Tax=Phaseolus angularis TaxID=3914 RepID=A0A0L9VJ65_PHAAN|nr:hypothetical protein LR48_Vigan10g090500 [Vigna angularis]
MLRRLMNEDEETLKQPLKKSLMFFRAVYSVLQMGYPVLLLSWDFKNASCSVLEAAHKVDMVVLEVKLVMAVALEMVHEAVLEMVQEVVLEVELIMAATLEVVWEVVLEVDTKMELEGLGGGSGAEGGAGGVGGEPGGRHGGGVRGGSGGVGGGVGGGGWVEREDEVEDVKGTLKYMISNRFSSGNYPAREDDRKSDVLVHWCHGALGTALTLVKAAKVFGDKEFLDATMEAGEVVWNPGLLKKVGICHDISGNAYVFLSLYQLTRDVKHLYRVKAFA